jgi:TrmH family RNA methyltransferase
VVAARRLATRSFRAERGLFLAEGPQSVREAATHPAGISELYFTDAAADRHPEIIEAARAAGATLVPTTDEVIASISDTVHPQGMVAVCHRLDSTLSDALNPPPQLVVLLAHVRDPGNVGSVIRAADAAGADAVLVSDESVDVYNPKAVRASVGSLFHVPIVIGLGIEGALEQCRAAGLRILAADGTGPLDLDDEADSGALSVPTCWIFGNEAWGLPDDVRSLADAVVRIPIHGRAESLNLSTAAAVCLYASARAHRQMNQKRRTSQTNEGSQL